MTDFLGIANEARADDVSSSIWSMLQHWEYRGDGPSRRLTGAELALVRAVIDDYSVLGNLTTYGAERLTEVCRELSEAVARGNGSTVPTNLLLDALYCIRALETELTKQRDANEVLMEAVFEAP